MKPDFDEVSALARARADGVIRFVCAGVVVRARRALVLKRKVDDFLPGIFELPSGKVEPGETLRAATIREVKEETGLDIGRIAGYLGDFDYLSRSGALTRQFSFLVEAADSDIVLSEHEEYRWVTLAELATLNATQDTKRIVLSALGGDSSTGS